MPWERLGDALGKIRITLFPESFERKRAACEFLRAGYRASDKSAICRIKNDDDSLNGICRSGGYALEFAKEGRCKFELGSCWCFLGFTRGRLHCVDSHRFPAERLPISRKRAGFLACHAKDLFLLTGSG